jgi:aminomethyltransferase
MYATATLLRPPADFYAAWATVDPAFLSAKTAPYRCKQEFASIAQMIADTLGQPQRLGVIAGSLIGATNWERCSPANQALAVKQGAAVFEASAMTYLYISGQDAAHVLDMLTPRDIIGMRQGQVKFCLFTTSEGTIDDEAIVLRLSETEFLLSSGACRPLPHALSCLDEALKRFPNVTVTTPPIVSFNIKGPDRLSAMSRLIDERDRKQIPKLMEFHFCTARFLNGHSVWVVKTRIGMELWGELDVIAEAWSEMLKHPSFFTPCGWDILHGYRMDCEDIRFYLYPLDFGAETDLRELGCDWMMREKDREYIGRSTLMSPAAPRRVIRKIHAPSSSAAERGAPLFTTTGDYAGYVSSSALSLRSNDAIAFAHFTPSLSPHASITDKQGSIWTQETP